MNGVAPEELIPDAFNQGLWTHAYKALGAHPTICDGCKAWHFALYAPNAFEVSLVGDFNNWNPEKHPLSKQPDGVWHTTVKEDHLNAFKNALDFVLYQYAVTDVNGNMHLKADPYAFYAEREPSMASIIYDLSKYRWRDDVWLAQRALLDIYKQPVNIYEMHVGSWKRHQNGSFYSYDEIGDEIIPYLKEMGYTHLELMPIMAHPNDASWGYQLTGFYAATARYGEPIDLMRLIDRCHLAGIGVILDWAPAHFPRHEAGLNCFDGSTLYEHHDIRRADMPLWGTSMFDLSKGEVRSFLLSSAVFWLEQYHVDGIRVDAVDAMLYYDFCRENGTWLPNSYGDNINLDAISFFRELNDSVSRHFPGVMMIAEDSSAYPMMTAKTYLGGLGFTFRWNMRFANDMLSYVQMDTAAKRYQHEKLTFSLSYAFNEHYILPYSHAEVVYGKRSMIDKQPGDLWRKFAGLRALYAFTMAHPGKKLLFMGSEFAQFAEWDYRQELDWFLLVYEKHPNLKDMVKALNHLYQNTPALYEQDDSWDGFTWLGVDDKDNSVVAFMRTDQKGRSIVAVTNFTPAFHPIYRIALPRMGTLFETFNTDLAMYGGSNQYNANALMIEASPFNGMPCSVNICVPPLATVYFDYYVI